VRVYGSPWTPHNGNWAFQYPRSEDVWTRKIPAEVDILVTHGPPRGHLDLMSWGCLFLLKEVWRIRPRLHAFGHVHEGVGVEMAAFDGVQRAYERTIVDGGGILNFVRTAVEFLLAWRRPSAEAKCIMVNAAIVGGLRHDQRREATKVIV
jgi:hypothetical protein